jgi:hypothetical protein
MDLIYLAKPSGGTLIQADDLRWFTLSDLDRLKPDEEIFAETQMTIKHILDTY